ncbi:hypothetical protein MY4038_007263 [Beauveria bassiana]
MAKPTDTHRRLFWPQPYKNLVVANATTRPATAHSPRSPKFLKVWAESLLCPRKWDSPTADDAQS